MGGVVEWRGVTSFNPLSKPPRLIWHTLQPGPDGFHSREEVFSFAIHSNGFNRSNA